MLQSWKQRRKDEMKIGYSSTGINDRILTFYGDDFQLNLEAGDIDKLKEVLQKAHEIDDIILIGEEHEMLFDSDDLENRKLPPKKNDEK